MVECGWPVAGGSWQVSFVSGNYILSMGLVICEGVQGDGSEATFSKERLVGRIDRVVPLKIILP
jgi:hypothetical protein